MNYLASGISILAALIVPAISLGGNYSGKVIDAGTGDPISGIHLEYSSDKYDVKADAYSALDGSFSFTNLPEGPAKLDVDRDQSSGYAGVLPWPCDWIYLTSGQTVTGRIVALQKGALVTGRVKNSTGSLLANFDIHILGLAAKSSAYTDAAGVYKIMVAPGDYLINSDQDDYTSLPLSVTVTDVNAVINMPDITAYNTATGSTISGTVSNPDGYEKTGPFVIAAWPAGTRLDGVHWIVRPNACADAIDTPGSFAISGLPPEAAYDIYFAILSSYPGTVGMGSVTVRSISASVPVGTHNLAFTYDQTGTTLSGLVKNAFNQPILGAAVTLCDSVGKFYGVAQTDPNGSFALYNLAPKTYTLYAAHSRYNTLTTIATVSASPVSVGTLTLAFSGQPQAADFNGSGTIDLFDMSIIAGKWLKTDSSTVDLNRDATVDYKDLRILVRDWLCKAYWLL